MQSQVCNISGDMQNLLKCPRDASCHFLIEASKTLHDLIPLPYNVISSLPHWPPRVPTMSSNLFLPQDLCTC